MTVGYSDSLPTLYVVHGRAKLVLRGPNSTEQNLLHTGLDDCLNMLRHALEKGRLLIVMDVNNGCDSIGLIWRPNHRPKHRPHGFYTGNAPRNAPPSSPLSI